MSAHERRYGYRMDDEPVELINVRLVATIPGRRPVLSEPLPRGDALIARRVAIFDGVPRDVVILDRTRMGAGSRVEGPSVVEFPGATCVVPPGWSGSIDSTGMLILEQS